MTNFDRRAFTPGLFVIQTIITRQCGDLREMGKAGKSAMANEYRALGDIGNRPSAAVRLLILGVASLGAAIFLFFYRENLNETFLLVMLGLLAMVGVFYLFASAIGFVEFARSDQAEDVGRAYADSMADGICILNEKGSIVYSNKAYGEMIGASGAEDLQAPDSVLSRHDDAANAVYRLANSLIRGLEADEEFRLQDGLSEEEDGARWYRASVRLLQPKKRGAPLRVWRLADITAERDDQEQTFLELQKAIDYLDQAPVGFFSADAEGRVHYVNATLAGWLGIDLTTFVPGSVAVSDIVASDGMAMIQAVRAEAGTVRTAALDLELMRADGVSVPVQIIHRVHAEKDGQVASTRTIVLNRSEGAETVDDLRRSEIRFTRFFNSTPMAIAALDKDGRILRTNAPFMNLFGTITDADGVDGQVRFEALMQGDSQERFRKAFMAAAANQAKIEPFDTVINPGAKERHLRVFVNAVAGHGGNSVCNPVGRLVGEPHLAGRAGDDTDTIRGHGKLLFSGRAHQWPTRVRARRTGRIAARARLPVPRKDVPARLAAMLLLIGARNCPRNSALATRPTLRPCIRGGVAPRASPFTVGNSNPTDAPAAIMPTRTAG